MPSSRLGTPSYLVCCVCFILPMGRFSCSALFIGVIVALIAVRPISSKYPLAPLISTIGATLIMQNVAVSVFGGENQSFPETMDPVIYSVAGVTVSNIQIFTLLMSMIIMVALWQFVGRSKTGRAIRAVAESHETAALMGVNVGRTVLVTFFLASCLAGAAGVLDGVKNSAVSPFIPLLTLAPRYATCLPL